MTSGVDLLFVFGTDIMMEDVVEKVADDVDVKAYDGGIANIVYDGDTRGAGGGGLKEFSPGGQFICPRSWRFESLMDADKKHLATPSKSTPQAPPPLSAPMESMVVAM